jgi:hypothetical protein
MNYEIQKVTGRKYGIHRGKPPTKLISGSGREYYYSRGIVAVVVEVGTRNIPDFMQNMKESIDENIPALLRSLREAKNYAKNAPKRVENFMSTNATKSEVTLSWDYIEDKDIYFQVFRNIENKESCTVNNLVCETFNRTFTDIQLKSSTPYYYYIRAVNSLTDVKSPFAPKTKVKTLLDDDEFAKTIFPNPKAVGYVAQKSLETNIKHFGINSLFIGVNETKGKSFGVMEFDLSTIPANAIIKDVQISLYPLNRVNTKIEKYGEWKISFIDQDSVSQINDYEQIDNATIIETLGDNIPSEQLTQGIWSHWNLNETERSILESQLQNKKVLFKIHGPETLPEGKDSQMMMFDLGYGKFGGGLHYRPNMDITYTIPTTKVEIKAANTTSIYNKNIIENELVCGFDNDNNKIYGLIEFNLDNLPDANKIVITNSFIHLKNKSASKTKEDIRYNVEFIEMNTPSCDSIQNRDRIEFIGYEVSRADIQKKKTHNFIFDKYSTMALEDIHKTTKLAKFIIKPTSSNIKNHIVSWHTTGESSQVKLVLEYIDKRNNPVDCISNLECTIKKSKISLSWENPIHEDFKGVYVVRNRFHTPQSPLDGDKIYAGSDNYTIDDFGSTDICKYYSIFTYDDVPNYSKAVSIKYESL